MLDCFTRMVCDSLERAACGTRSSCREVSARTWFRSSLSVPFWKKLRCTTTAEALQIVPSVVWGREAWIGFNRKSRCVAVIVNKSLHGMFHTMSKIPNMYQYAWVFGTSCMKEPCKWTSCHGQTPSFYHNLSGRSHCTCEDRWHGSTCVHSPNTQSIRIAN